MQPCVTVKSAVCLLLKEHKNLMTVPPCVCLCARFYLCEDSLPIWKIRAFFFFKLRSLLKSLKISKQGLVLKSDDTSHFKDFLRVCALFQHKD